MDSPDLIGRLRSALPTLRKWIDDLLEAHKDQAAPIINLGFQRLQQAFPSELLENAKVVVVAGKPPFPPFSRIGLPELSEMESVLIDGITYKDTFFVNQAHRSESCIFHELVHVVQWRRLGVDNFLMAYGIGLMHFGYRDSPLEQMAFLLQGAFDHGNPPTGIVDIIGQRTDAIWRSVAPLINET